MTTKRRITIFFIALGAMFLIFAIWYKYEFSMNVAQEFEVNSPDLNHKLLIATQGSEFKNEVTEGIVNFYKNDSVFIKVIDITSLASVNPTAYSAIVVMHTWENWQPPENVELFINRTKDIENKIIVLTTSGNGNFKMEGIDAITGESILEDTSTYVNHITKRLEPILNLNSM
ncbi:hypothetical protein [uncultured Winogradskyella sp.]|uniref:hypothetical protein n=1 Tax=uncultured Winogradskyella sp. TaxID=395353 RepID=UPI0026238B63|nr:hypothetical protein [uncultured Winogradskyella sp.]